MTAFSDLQFNVVHTNETDSDGFCQTKVPSCVVGLLNLNYNELRDTVLWFQILTSLTFL